jgi:hypothetical protein
MATLLRGSTLTVPVLIDDSGHESTTTSNETSTPVSLVRGVYFVFDASQPSPGWSLNINGRSLPFFMVGLSGIVYRAAGVPEAQNGWFLTTSDIEQTFEFIERTRGMIVETGRIYLPLRVVEACIRTPHEHDVLRVRGDMFVDALQFAQGRLMDHDYEKRLDSYVLQTPVSITGVPLVQSSPEETQAFACWCEEQLRSARQQESIWASDGLLRPEEDHSTMPF